MEERVTFGSGIRPLIATVVGVGFFTLPYEFAHVGYGIVFLELLFMVTVQILFLQVYADLALAKHDHSRFLHIIGDAFRAPGKILASLCFFGTLWGAMIAYILTAATFLSYLTKSWFVVPLPVLYVVVGGVFMACLAGGQFFVVRAQRYLVPFFLCVIALLCVAAFPAVSLSRFSFGDWHVAFPVLGVLLFSLSGISVIPEMRDALRAHPRRLYRAITLGMIVVGAMYALFAALVVGITGSHTPVQAIAAFAGVAPWMVLVGSLFGITTLFTTYLHIGTALMHTLLADFRVRYLRAWIIVGGVPLVAVMLGVQNVLGVLQYVGGVLGALLGIFVLLAYEKARSTRQLSPHTHPRSPFLIFGLFIVFFFVLVTTLRG